MANKDTRPPRRILADVAQEYADLYKQGPWRIDPEGAGLLTELRAVEARMVRLLDAIRAEAKS